MSQVVKLTHRVAAYTGNTGFILMILGATFLGFNLYESRTINDIKADGVRVTGRIVGYEEETIRASDRLPKSVYHAVVEFTTTDGQVVQSRPSLSAGRDIKPQPQPDRVVEVTYAHDDPTRFIAEGAGTTSSANPTFPFGWSAGLLAASGTAWLVATATARQRVFPFSMLTPKEEPPTD